MNYAVEAEHPVEKKVNFPVKLEVFEGPLDLLLFLIRKNEIDIYAIPIALITRQYLEYIELMQELDLDLASEFILMASILIRIKMKMLLPRDETEDEVEDPRDELVNALLEYKKFKEAAQTLQRKEEEEKVYFPRADSSSALDDNGSEPSQEADLFDLLMAFKKVLDNQPKESFHSIEFQKVDLEQRIQFILDYLSNKDKVNFEELFQDNPVRLVLVVTFMAILELIRLQEIRVIQRKHFSKILIYRNKKG
ncbi:MAG: segregation/condensation protein A [candidate division Zixibacteria bacterium]|nr:segregation/condensation protein A [candidate division Zixibacteria bacterium]